MRTITETAPDLDAGSLQVQRNEGGAIVVKVRFDVLSSAGETRGELVRRTLPQLVSSGVLTANERDAFKALVTKIRAGLRTALNLDPQ